MNTNLGNRQSFADRQKKVEQLRFISQLMDARFIGPFGIRFGLDGLIGLIPGIGDLITTCVSLYIVAGAYQLGVGPAILARMLLNQGIDSLVGLIPFIGDLFDIGWKSNLKNMNLLDRYLANPARVKRRSWLLVFALLLAFLVLLTLVIFGIVLLFRSLF